MNSIHRIFAVVRAFVQEFSLITYFLGPIFFVGFSSFITIISQDQSNNDGQILSEYLHFGAHQFIPLMVVATVLAATIISLEFVSNELKTEQRGIRLLSLPVSQGERFGALLIIVWLVVPLIVIIPIFVLASMVVLLAPVGALLPDPSYLLSAIWIGWLAYIGLSLFWLTPALGFAKRAWIIFMIVLFGVGTYIAATRSNTEHSITFQHDLSALQDESVVGLSELSVLTDQTPRNELHYSIKDPFDLAPWSLIFIAALLLGSSFFALNHQKS